MVVVGSTGVWVVGWRCVTMCRSLIDVQEVGRVGEGRVEDGRHGPVTSSPHHDGSALPGRERQGREGKEGEGSGRERMCPPGALCIKHSPFLE